MPQMNCSKCFSKLTTNERRAGQIQCDRCQAEWRARGSSVLGAAAPGRPAMQQSPTRRR